VIPVLKSVGGGASSKHGAGNNQQDVHCGGDSLHSADGTDADALDFVLTVDLDEAVSFSSKLVPCLVSPPSSQ